MEKKIDIIPFLERVVEENTHHYQSDFEHDERRLQKAMLEVSQENRTLLWMSRPCGTYCVLEREAFIAESPAHIVWTNTDYVRQANKIKAYRIIVAPGYPGAFVLGKIQPLNYKEQVQRIMRNAVHAQTVDVTFEDRTTHTMPYQEYTTQFGRLIAAHGKIEHIHFKPENEDKLSCILQAERMSHTVKKRHPRKKSGATR